MRSAPRRPDLHNEPIQPLGEGGDDDASSTTTSTTLTASFAHGVHSNILGGSNHLHGSGALVI